ncbi:MAG: YecA family protein [Candidatus Woesearchaeota archaeon]
MKDIRTFLNDMASKNITRVIIDLNDKENYFIKNRYSKEEIYNLLLDLKKNNLLDSYLELSIKNLDNKFTFLINWASCLVTNDFIVNPGSNNFLQTIIQSPESFLIHYSKIALYDTLYYKNYKEEQDFLKRLDLKIIDLYKLADRKLIYEMFCRFWYEIKFIILTLPKDLQKQANGFTRSSYFDIYKFYGLPINYDRAYSRNDTCPCGSGNKFKYCCLNGW